MALNMDDETPWERLRLVIDNAVHHLGLKEVVFKLNAAKSTVSDALGDKNDRHWRQEWTLTILEMLADRYSETSNQYAKAILDAQAALTRRFEVVAVDDSPSDAEIAAAQRVLDAAKKRKTRAR
jgi:hypothetical protein